MKMSLEPALTSAAPPRFTVPKKLPVTTTLPLPSTATTGAWSQLVPPNRFDHTCAPVAAYFAMKMSVAVVLALVSGPPPKSTVPVKVPATTMSPVPSTATVSADSSIVPPIRVAHTGAPVAEYFTMKMSLAPALVSDSFPKSTVPLKDPTTTRFPFPAGERSTATAWTVLVFVPLKARTHTNSPVPMGGLGSGVALAVAPVEMFPTASVAHTRYPYVVPFVSPVWVKLVPLPVSSTVPLAQLAGTLPTLDTSV